MRLNQVLRASVPRAEQRVARLPLRSSSASNRDGSRRVSECGAVLYFAVTDRVNGLVLSPESGL